MKKEFNVIIEKDEDGFYIVMNLLFEQIFGS